MSPIRKLPPFDPYKVLQVAQDASLEDIKKSYRQLALQLHPDKAGQSSQADFVKLQAAYEILSDVENRADYHRLKGLKKPRGGWRPSAYYNPADDFEAWRSAAYDEFGELNPDASKRKWYERGSTQDPTKKMDVRFRGREWCIKAAGKATKDLHTLRDGINAIMGSRLCECASQKDTIWEQLCGISGDLNGKLATAKSVKTQLNTVQKGQWKVSPETQAILADLYRLQDKIELMLQSLTNLKSLVQTFESQSKKTRKHTKHLFVVELSMWGHDRTPKDD
ncbi:DnaJ domain-containing protein [Hypomontagnella monticulosa]|nr:DnaJ domain-containing protein [Hypomontagnella monticulosa]